MSQDFHSFLSGLWVRIRIRMDPGGKNFQIKTEKDAMKLVKISNFIQFLKSKFAQLSLFLTFEQFLMFFTTKENFF